jgi:hypothetical protein
MGSLYSFDLGAVVEATSQKSKHHHHISIVGALYGEVELVARLLRGIMRNHFPKENRRED